ncbi:MAG: acyltransferase [Candidatus Helarchaeota archaeon]
MKIPEGMKELFKISPLLKYAHWVRPYFVSEEDASTEKSKKRIRDFQEKITKMIVKNCKRSLEKPGAKKTRKLRKATEKEERRFHRFLDSFFGELRLRARISLLSNLTPTFKANYLRDLGANVGERVMITFGNLIDVIFAREISIGDDTVLGMGSILTCCEVHDDQLYIGSISIGKNTLIGAGAIILPGVSIGDNCIITPGVVAYDVPDNTLCIGFPEDIHVPLEGEKISLTNEKRRVEKTPWDLHDWRSFLPSSASILAKNALLEIQKLPISQEIRKTLLRLAGVKIGKDVFIDDGVVFDPWWPEKITIEDGAKIRKYAVIATHEGLPPPSKSEIHKGSLRVGEVRIGKNVLVEAGTGILPGVTIGDDAEVLPYTFIATDVKEGIQVEGIPSRKVGETFDIDNFLEQQFGYTSSVWDEIQQFREKEAGEAALAEESERLAEEDVSVKIREPSQERVSEPSREAVEITPKETEKPDDISKESEKPKSWPKPI